MQVADYKVKWKFGITAPLPWTPSKPHLGVDRSCPLGTELRVNGELLAYTDDTGGVDPHHHLQKVQGGKVVDPGDGGFNIPAPAVVYSVDLVDDTNIGKNIRIRDAQGVEWSHFHIDRIQVNVGHTIGGNTVSTVGEVEFNNLYRAFFGPMEVNPPTDGDRKRWIGAETNTVIRAMEVDPRHPAWLAYIESLKAGPAATVLNPGIYQVE